MITGENRSAGRGSSFSSSTMTTMTTISVTSGPELLVNLWGWEFGVVFFPTLEKMLEENIHQEPLSPAEVLVIRKALGTPALQIPRLRVRGVWLRKPEVVELLAGAEEAGAAGNRYLELQLWGYPMGVSDCASVHAMLREDPNEQVDVFKVGAMMGQRVAATRTF